MMISVTALSILIIAATALVAVAPFILLVLWLKDKRGGQLW